MASEEKNYIPLSDKYYIGVDKYNWILYKKSVNKKTGAEEIKAEKFFPTLESLLENVFEMNLRHLCVHRDDLKGLVYSMSTERKKFSELARSFCEGINRSDMV